jgi:hypothetical protein
MVSCGLLLQPAWHGFLLCQNMRLSTAYYSLYNHGYWAVPNKGFKKYFLREGIKDILIIFSLLDNSFSLCEAEYY